MGTRAYIGIKNEDNTITAIYNQCDGGLQNLGHLLRKHFKTEASVRELIELGYISSVQDMETYNHLKENFNYFDSTEWKALNTVENIKVHLMPKYIKAEVLNNIEDVMGTMIAYAYLFIPKDNKWYYTKGNGLSPLYE